MKRVMKYYVKKDFLYPSKFTAAVVGKFFCLDVSRRRKRDAVADIERYIRKLGFIPERLSFPK